MAEAFRPELLARFATDVAVLWDEAQDDPKLMRFLAPFGRPDLRRIARAFSSASSPSQLIEEVHPVYATWLATMLLREGGAEAVKLDALAPRGSLLHPSLLLTKDLELGPGATLVVSGSLDARMVLVRGGCLVVAGELRCRLLVADGCVLIGGRLEADIVSAPATRLVKRDERRAPAAIGWQVADSVRCRVFDSPRFGLSCPVVAEVVTRAVGLPVTPDASLRLRALLVDKLATAGQGVDVEAIAWRLARGHRIFR